jgi:hypothetical protein
MVLEQQSVEGLSAEQLRELASRLLTDVRHKQAVIDKLTHENALLKRLKFAAQSERYSAEQRACWTKRWTLTCRRSATRSRRWHPLQPPRLQSNNPNASRYRPTCHAARSATSPNPPPVAVDAR